MSLNKTVITYACSKVCPDTEKQICNKLLKELPIELLSVSSIQEIFPLLSDPIFHTDFIVFDVDDLQELDNVDAFDLVRTLSTIINCTVHRPVENKKPIKRNTKIIAMVSEHTPYKVLKELIAMNEVSNFSLKAGGKVNYELLKMIVENYINYGPRPHPAIIDLLKPKKPTPKKKTGTIQLTLRQQQIYDIVTTRGSSNKHIARMLDISESTVKLHIGAILKKYNLKNRTQLAVFCKK